MASPAATTAAGEPSGNPLPTDLSVNVLPSGDVSVAEPAPPAPPTETQQETSAPEQGQQEPPADSPSSPAPNYESKEFKDFLARYGGNPEAAAKAFFATDTRAAAMAKALKDRGIDPVTLQPIQTEQEPPAAPEPPEAPVELDARAVDQEVLRALENDQQAVSLTNEFTRINDRLKAIDAEVPSLTDKVRVAELRLTIPEIASDSFRKAEVQDELREIRSRLQDLKAESRELRADKNDTVARYSQLANRYRDQVKGYLGKQAQETAAKAAFESAVTRHEQEFTHQWPSAIDQAIKTHNIPQDLAEDFREEAKIRALAFNGPIQNIPEFVDGVAKKLMATTDKYHRVKSAQFGAQAVARASTPGPTGPAAVAPHQPDSVPASEADLNKSAFRRLNDNLRSAFGGR